ncbi:hypothetical protein BLNAU_14210 [Blattamonas nauphoetae]|uniref:Uncharacterized protein n=1 Tax=Blattamonas nauphoetae TaxID=2049346 RepID=A0ABQ9XEL3_9EUKA|nr:hypothetical protein BLNAU_14210 [Blattamonas nauphoetae]
MEILQSRSTTSHLDQVADPVHQTTIRPSRRYAQTNTKTTLDLLLIQVIILAPAERLLTHTTQREAPCVEEHVITINDPKIICDSLTLISKNVSFSGASTNSIAGIYGDPFLFDIVNTSLRIESLTICPSPNQIVTVIEEDSDFSLIHSIISLTHTTQPTLLTHGGSISIHDLKIDASDIQAISTPLIHSDDFQTEVSQNSVSLSSAYLVSDAPFLLSGRSHYSTISASAFYNISTSLIENDTRPVDTSPHCVNTSIVTSSIFRHCDSTYTGSLIDADRTVAISMRNSTFSHGVLNVNPLAPESFTTTVDLSNNKFEAYSRTDNGGAFSLITSSWSDTMTAEGNIFINCRCTSTSESFGGALYVKGGTLNCRWTTFESCSAFSGGAIGAKSAKLVVSDCSFTSCTASCPTYSGDAIQANQYDGNKPNGGGGAMWIQTDGDITVTGCAITSCHAPSFGGGIVLWPFVEVYPTDIYIDNLIFTDTNITTFKGDRSGGHNIYIASQQFFKNDGGGRYDAGNTQDYFTNTNDGQIARIRDIFTDTKLWGNNIHQVQVGTSSYLTQTVAEAIDSHVYVALTGTNKIKCGWESEKCRTVTYGANKVKNDKKVIIAAGEYDAIPSYSESCVLVNDRTVTMEGNGKYVPSSSGTIIHFNKPNFLETANVKVTTGAFSATKVTMELSATSSDEWNLIEMTDAGTVTLTNSALTGTGSAQKGRLIVMTAGSMEISSCDFSSITSNLGTGAAIHVTLHAADSFSISDSSFSSCSVGSDAGSRGAGLYLKTEAGAGDFDLKILTFTGNTAEKGKDIYINSEDVDANLTPAKFIAEWTDDLTDNTRFVCKSQGGTYGGVEQGIPHYFTIGMVIYLDQTESNAVGCGKEANPCNSLTYAAEQKGFDIAGYPVNVVAVGVLDGSVDASGTTIQPKSTSTTALLNITAASSISTTKTLSITNITFGFSVNAASSNPLLSVSATGSLTLTNVAFSATSLLTAPTILSVVSGGTITANSFSVSSLSFSTAIVSIATSSISIGDISVTSCTCTGSLSTHLLSIQLTAATTAQLNVGSITFNSLTTPATTDSSKLTLTVVKGTPSTEITSKTTLLTASSNSFSSNTALSFSGTSSAPVALLTMELGAAFAQSVSSSSVVFAASTSAATTALADTTSSSLVLSLTTINLSNLNGFYTTALFTVPANNLIVTQATLSSLLLGNKKMTTPFAIVSGGTATLTKVNLDGSVLADDFAHSMLKQTGGKLILNNCAFNSITTTDEGAAIKANLGTGVTLSLTAVAFTSCKSTGSSKNGGALHVTVSGGSFTTTAPITFTTCSTTGKGSKLYLSSSTLSTIISSSALTTLKPTLPTTKADTDAILNDFYGYESASSEGSLLYWWYPHTITEQSTHTHPNGADHAKCGLLQLPCQTITHTLLSTNSKNSFILDAALTMADTPSITSAVILSSSTLNLAITVTTGTFTVPSGSLTLKTLAFTGPNTDKTSSFVTVSGTGSLIITGSSFNSFKTSGNGGAISVALTTGTFTADASTSFAGCSAANGGAIAIDLTGRTGAGAFTLSSVTFGTPANTATKGSDIFVLTASGGRSYLTAAQFGNSQPTTPSSGTFFGAADMNKWYFKEPTSVEGSILYLLYPYKGGTLSVHSSSEANNLCGHTLLPCKTLEDGNTLVRSTTTSNADDACVVLLSDVSVTTAIASTSTVEWKSDSTRRTITLSADVGVTVSGGSLTVSDLKLTVTFSSFSTSFFTLSGGSLSVKSSEFSSISTTGEGSAIKANLGTGQTLSLTGVTFTSCQSTGTSKNGGALHVTVDGGSFTTTAPITFTTCSTTGNGNKLYLSSPTASTIVTTALTTLKPASLPTTKLATDAILNDFYGYESASLEGSLLYLWFPHTTGDVYVHSAGEDRTRCGLLQLPCQTLVYGNEKVKETGKRIVLSTDSSLAVVFPNRFAAQTITSENTPAKSIDCSSSAAFVVDTAANTLTLDTLTITHAASQPTSPIISVSDGKCVLNAVGFGSSSVTTVSTPLISVTGGTLEATSVNIQKFSSSSTSLIVIAGGSSTLSGMKASTIQSQSAMISMTAGNLVIEDSEFERVQNTGGNGSVLHASVGTGQSLTVIDGSVTDCTSSGCGGALFVKLSGTGSFTLDGISGTEFSGCKADQTGQCVTLQVIGEAKGFLFDKVHFPSTSSGSNPVPFLLVDADSLLPIIKRSRFQFLSPFALTSDHEFLYSGFQGGDKLTKIPLYPYLLTTDIVYLSTDSGSDSEVCGSDAAPCVTLGIALNRRTASPPSDEETGYELVVMDTGKIDAPFNVGDYVLKVTSNAQKTLVFSNNAKFTMTPPTSSLIDFTISNLILSWNGPATTLVTQTKGKLNIMNVELSTVGGVIFAGNLIDTTSSTVKFSQLTLSPGSNKVGSVLKSTGSSVTLETVSFSDITLTSSLMAGNGDVTITDSSFSSITDSGSSLHTLSHTANNGNLIIIGTSTSPVTFTSCSSAGNGGCLNVIVKGTGKLQVQSTTFKQCSSGGNGGAIFVDLDGASLSTQLTLQTAVFGSSADVNECGVGKSGNDVFIKAGSLATFKDKNLFPSSYSSTPTPDAAALSSILLSSTHTKHVLPVQQYLMTLGTDGTVSTVSSNNNEDINQCGHLVINCRTINQLAKNSLTMQKALIDTETTISSSFVIPRDFGIIPTATPATLKLTAVPALSVGTGFTLTLSDLSIKSSGAASNAYQPLISVSGSSSKLIVSDCTFSVTGAGSTSALIECTSGAEASIVNAVPAPLDTTIPIIVSGSSTLTLENVTLQQSSSASNTDELLCEWNDGLLFIDHSTLIMTECSLTNINNNPILLAASTATLTGTSVSGNGSPSSDYPSAKQNLRCTDSSEISVDTVIDWVSDDGTCVDVNDVLETVLESFSPTITTNTTVLADNNESVTVDLTGTQLFPCQLSFVVARESDDSVIAKLTVGDETTLSKSETTLSIHLDLMELDFEDNETLVGFISTPASSTANFTLGTFTKPSDIPPVEPEPEKPDPEEPEKPKSNLGQLLSWLIPVIVGAAVVLALTIIFIILGVRHHNRKKTLNKVHAGQEFDQSQSNLALLKNQSEVLEMSELKPSNLTDVVEAYACTERLSKMSIDGSFTLGTVLVDVGDGETKSQQDPSSIVEPKVFAHLLAVGMEAISKESPETFAITPLYPSLIGFTCDGDPAIIIPETAIKTKGALSRVGSVDSLTSYSTTVSRPFPRPSMLNTFFQAPEVAGKPALSISEPALVYSYGGTLTSFITACLPTTSLPLLTLARSVTSPKLRRVAEMCLNPTPHARPTFPEIIAFLNSSGDGPSSDEVDRLNAEFVETTL